MNFKYISETFGARVFVWGASGYITARGERINKFIPTKRLHELRDLARQITIVAQDYEGTEFYTADFDADKLFTGNDILQ